jgi:hypothetical protein
MAAVRDQVCRVRANDPLWDKAQALKNAIDDMAGELTGDREYFFAKHHSLCQGPPADRRG